MTSNGERGCAHTLALPFCKPRFCEKLTISINVPLALFIATLLRREDITIDATSLHPESMSNSYNQNLFSNNNSSFNVTNSNNTTNNYRTVNDEESQILSWISPLESWKRHSDVARVRAEGVGEWVLQSNEFQAWWQDGNNESVGRVMFCHGVPGAGKTFIW